MTFKPIWQYFSALSGFVIILICNFFHIFTFLALIRIEKH